MSLALLGGVLLSNLPEGMSSSSGLKAAGWPQRRVVLMWSAVVVVSAIAAAVGYVALESGERPHRRTRAGVCGRRAPDDARRYASSQAYAVEGIWTGPLVVTGFAISIGLSAI